MEPRSVFQLAVPSGLHDWPLQHHCLLALALGRLAVVGVGWKVVWTLGGGVDAVLCCDKLS